VTDGIRRFEQPTGFIFDTVTSTTIHSGTNIASRALQLGPRMP
jgi:hypothetical protein